MQIVKRVLLLTFVSFAALASLSCKGNQPNANQQNTNAGQARAGRWVAQYRSPDSKAYTGTNLSAAFFYSAISVLSKDVVFVAGDVVNPKTQQGRLGVVVRTSDGGQTWTERVIEQPGAEIGSLNSIHFVSPEIGWVVGASPERDDDTRDGLVLKTTDGGDTWTLLKVDAKQVPTSIFFVDSETGWLGGATPLPGNGDDGDSAIGGPSAILTTTDGGRTWREQINLPVSIFDINFIDKTTGWASGSKGSIYHTADGGRTWDSQRTELEVGDGPVNLQSEGLKQFSMLGVHFTDAQNGFAAGSAEEEDIGYLIATSNGGNTWAKKWKVADSGVRDIFFLSPTVGWAVTNRGAYVYYTVDGAHSWLSEPKVFEQEVTLVRLGAADAGHVWAVGGGAIFFRVTE